MTERTCIKNSRLSALVEFEDGITVMPSKSYMKVGEVQEIKWSDGKVYEGYVIAIGKYEIQL